MESIRYQKENKLFVEWKYCCSKWQLHIFLVIKELFTPWVVVSIRVKNIVDNLLVLFFFTITTQETFDFIVNCIESSRVNVLWNVIYISHLRFLSRAKYIERKLTKYSLFSHVINLCLLNVRKTLLVKRKCKENWFAQFCCWYFHWNTFFFFYRWIDWLSIKYYEKISQNLVKFDMLWIRSHIY